MKKLVLSVLMITVATMFATAQTVIFSDNFDSYTPGSHLAESNSAWTTWTGVVGGDLDGVISDEHYTSPSNSLYISESNDQIFRFDSLSTGSYLISFQYFIPSSGNGAYFNVEHIFGGSWAMACYFYNDGNAYLKVGGDTIHYSYPSDHWFPIELKIDLDNDEASLKVNYQNIHSWPYHYRETDTTSNFWSIYLHVFNFFSSSATPNPAGSQYSNLPGSYYVDDFVVTDITSVSVNEHNPIEVSVYPNPASNYIQINAENIEHVEIYNIMGQKIFNKVYGDNKVVIPTSNISSGTYVVKVTTTQGVSTQKVVIQ